MVQDPEPDTTLYLPNKAQDLYRYSPDEIYTPLYMYISPGSVCALQIVLSYSK